MTNVTLHGELATAMGRAQWAFSIQQPREALAAIEANTGKLYHYLHQRHEESAGAVQYRVIVDGRELGAPSPDDVRAEWYEVGVFVQIDIVPVMAGAGGLWQTIIGVVLIIVGVVLLFTPAATIAPYVIMAGISLTLGGIAQLLTPTPKLGTSPFARSFASPDSALGLKKEDAKATANYLFSGAVNTTQQGNPVPIAYGGPMVVGSALVSMSVTTASLASSVIGAQKPPAATDPYFTLPVWTRIKLLPGRAPITNTTLVKRLSVVNAKAIATGFGFPERFPAGFGANTGKVIGVGDSKLATNTLKGYLSTLSYLFSGNPRPIKFVEAKNVVLVLNVHVSGLNTATWKTVILALARHFSPEP